MSPGRLRTRTLLRHPWSAAATPPGVLSAPPSARERVSTIGEGMSWPPEVSQSNRLKISIYTQQCVVFLCASVFSVHRAFPISKLLEAVLFSLYPGGAIPGRASRVFRIWSALSGIFSPTMLLVSGTFAPRPKITSRC